MVRLHRRLVATAVVARSAEEADHLQPHFYGERKLLRVSHPHISSLAVIDGAFRVARMPLGEVFLPGPVRRDAIADVALDAQPLSRAGYMPVFRQGEAHFRQWACVDAERLRAAAQAVVLELHGLLLDAEGEEPVFPSDFCKSLLDDYVARIVVGDGDIQSIAHAPAMQGVGQ